MLYNIYLPELLNSAEFSGSIKSSGVFMKYLSEELDDFFFEMEQAG